MEFINLTQHNVVLENRYLNITFPPSGKVARVDTVNTKEFVELEMMDSSIKISIPIDITPKVKVINLPEPKEGVMYIVSSYVAQHVKRDDVVAPLTDKTAERDTLGNILSVKAFQKYTNNVEIEHVEREYSV